MLAHDFRATPEIEREAGATDVENDGEAVSATGGRVPLAPAEADASASRTGTRTPRATPTIIAR